MQNKRSPLYCFLTMAAISWLLISCGISDKAQGGSALEKAQQSNSKSKGKGNSCVEEGKKDNSDTDDRDDDSRDFFRTAKGKSQCKQH